MFYKIIVISNGIQAYIIQLKSGVDGGWGGMGDWVGVSDGGGGGLKKTPLKLNRNKKFKFSKLCFFYSKRAATLAKTEVYTQKTENRPTYGDFGIHVLEPPTSPNF